MDTHETNEQNLDVQQSIKYAHELSSLYQSEKKKSRELELANKKLQDYAAELERSNRELQEFAFIASHDLQEPLRKISILADRLDSLDSELDERGKDYLSRMRNAAGRMMNYIDALLAYSQVFQKAPQPKKVDMNELVADVLSRFGRSYPNQ